MTTPMTASWVGNVVIQMGPNPYPDEELPFVLVPFMPVRRDVYGEPDGALLVENQAIMGAVTRGMIDAMGRSANGQTGMRKDMLDTTNKRKFQRGEDYEFNVGVDPRQGVYMHQFPEIPQSAPLMLQQQNMEAESLTGVKAFAGGLTGDAFGETATGTRGVLDSASKRELGILRRLAAGVIRIGRKITSMNGAFLSEEEVVRITNDQFVKVRRDELAGDFDLKLTISTAEEDNAKAEELGFMFQTLGNSVDFDITKIILAEQFRLRKMPTLAHKLENYQPQPDPVQEQIQQLEIAKLQAEIAEIESRTRENHAEAGLDQAKTGTEVAKQGQIQAQTDKDALEFVENESGVTQERELEKLGVQARGNIALEREKAVIAGGQRAAERAESRREKDEDATREVQGELLKQYLRGSEASSTASR